jgi:hypothetical protein
MTYARLNLRHDRLALFAALALVAAGCGKTSPTTEPGILKEREDVIKALPKGVTLDSAVVPDKMYGESSKTVEDALRHLQAYVRERVLYDGGMGHEIRFDPAPPGSQKKTVKKTMEQPVYMIIKLAK